MTPDDETLPPPGHRARRPAGRRGQPAVRLAAGRRRTAPCSSRTHNTCVTDARHHRPPRAEARPLGGPRARPRGRGRHHDVHQLPALRDVRGRHRPLRPRPGRLRAVHRAARRPQPAGGWPTVPQEGPALYDEARARSRATTPEPGRLGRPDTEESGRCERWSTRRSGTRRGTRGARPGPAADGVVIRVGATGLCRSDWHGWMGHDPDIVLPHVPGHELAGVVAAVGAGVPVAGRRPGDRARSSAPAGSARRALPATSRSASGRPSPASRTGARSPSTSRSTTPTSTWSPLPDELDLRGRRRARLPLRHRVPRGRRSGPRPRRASGWRCTAAAASACPP